MKRYLLLSILAFSVYSIKADNKAQIQVLLGERSGLEQQIRQKDAAIKKEEEGNTLTKVRTFFLGAKVTEAEKKARIADLESEKAKLRQKIVEINNKIQKLEQK